MGIDYPGKEQNQILFVWHRRLLLWKINPKKQERGDYHHYPHHKPNSNNSDISFGGNITNSCSVNTHGNNNWKTNKSDTHNDSSLRFEMLHFYSLIMAISFFASKAQYCRNLINRSTLFLIIPSCRHSDTMSTIISSE